MGLYICIFSPETPQTQITIPYTKKIRNVSSLTDSTAEITYKRNKKEGTVTFTIPEMKRNEVDYILKVE